VKSINIYGWDIPIKKMKGLIEAQGVYGYYDPVARLIAIDASLKKCDYISTLIHEIVHAMFHRAGLHQTKISSSLEEIICEQVSTVLTENFSLTGKKKR
jgi:Zn-dependent peptidase ImmA (M78 family)